MPQTGIACLTGSHWEAAERGVQSRTSRAPSFWQAHGAGSRARLPALLACSSASTMSRCTGGPQTVHLKALHAFGTFCGWTGVLPAHAPATVYDMTATMWVTAYPIPCPACAAQIVAAWLHAPRRWLCEPQQKPGQRDGLRMAGRLRQSGACCVNLPHGPASCRQHPPHRMHSPSRHAEPAGQPELEPSTQEEAVTV